MDNRTGRGIHCRAAHKVRLISTPYASTPLSNLAAAEAGVAFFLFFVHSGQAPET